MGAVIEIPSREIEQFCLKWAVKELALFGSVLRGDFRSASDVDVLVTFDSAARPTLFSLAEMETELEGIFGRRVDLLERRGLEASPNPYFRDPVLSSVEIVYAR